MRERAIPKGSRRLPTPREVFGAFVLLGFACGAIPVFLGVLNHDVAWLLYVAGRVLDGAKLYEDVVENNPPLIIWLSLPPVLLAHALGISAILAFRLLVLALLGFSLTLSGWVLRRALPERVVARRGLLLLLLFILLPLVGDDFGQKEHLMLALLLPYLLAASARAMGRPLEGRIPWLLGVLAGVGIALKPYFVPLWLAVEGALAWIRRGERVWLRPEGAGVVLVGAVYGGALVGLTPEYLDLARRMRQAYAGYFTRPFAALLTGPGTLLSGFALLGYRVVRPRGDVRELCRIVLLANASLLGAVLVQRKGWSYHFYPVHASALLLLGTLVLAAWRRPDPSARVAGAVLGTVLLVFALVMPVPGVRASLQTMGCPGETETLLGRMIRLIKGDAGGRRIYVMSDLLSDAFPLVNYSDARWVSRFPSLWILPGLYPGGAAPRRPSRIARWTRRATWSGTSSTPW